MNSNAEYYTLPMRGEEKNLNHASFEWRFVGNSLFSWTVDFHQSLEEYLKKKSQITFLVGNADQADFIEVKLIVLELHLGL